MLKFDVCQHIHQELLLDIAVLWIPSHEFMLELEWKRLPFNAHVSCY